MTKQLVQLQAPEGATGVSFAGENYEVKGGLVQVPSEAVQDLVSGHGYSVPAAGQQGGTAAGKATAKGSTKAPANAGATAPAWAAGPQQ